MRGVIFCLIMGNYPRGFYKVVAYHLNGKIFRIYDSARQASLSNHGHPRTIDKCIRGNNLTAYGYMWRRVPTGAIPDRIEPYKTATISMGNRAIAKLTSNGGIIEVYSSIKEAAKKNNIDAHSIRDVLNGKYKHAGGYTYRELTDKEIEENAIYVGNNTGAYPIRINQYSLDGKYIKSYSSIGSAARTIGRPAQGIQQCLKRKSKTAYGFIWKKAK